MEKKSLHCFFLENKQTLQCKMSGLYIPQDLERVQSIISDFFESQISSNGQYASQLSEPEYYILHSSFFLREFQNQLDDILSAKDNVFENSDNINNVDEKVTSSPMAFFYVAAGGLALSACGPWGTLAGSLSGLIVSTLLYKTQPKSIVNNKYFSWLVAKPSVSKGSKKCTRVAPSELIDVETVLGIVEKFCKGIDDFMLTVKNQINRLIPQESSIYDKIGPVITECQKFLGRLHKSGYDKDSVSYFEEVWQMVGVEFKHYSKENEAYFLRVSKPDISMIEELYPAVLIEGNVYAKGSVYLPDELV